MNHMATRWIPQWSVVLLAVLLLPDNAPAQAPIIETPTYPWQTIMFNAGVLQVDPGRVRFGLKKSMSEYAPTISPTTTQWTDFNNAQTFLYPIDEWSPSYISMSGIAGGVEAIIYPNAETPRSIQYTGNYRAPNAGDTEGWWYARRWRPPYVLVSSAGQGLKEYNIMAPGQYIADPNLPSDQAVYTVNQLWFDRNGLAMTRNLYAMENSDLDRAMFIYEREWHSGVWRRTAGSSGDSTIYLPEGQVLSLYHGWRWMGEHARSILLWQNSNAAPWNQQKQDDYAVTIEHASRYLSPAEAPRAANLQVAVVKDGYSDNLNDWDGGRLDDTGNPYMGPTFTRNDITRETGEFVGDGIIGQGYIYFARGDGEHDTDWFNPVDVADRGPTNIHYLRYKQSNAVTGAGYGSTAAFWEKMKSVSIDRGYGDGGRGFITDYFEGLGANVNGIEWTGVTAGMVDGQPAWPSQEKFNSYMRVHMVGGPILLDPGERHERMLVVCAGDLPRKESVALGQRYLKWVAQQKPGVHPNGDALPASVVPLSDLEKWQVMEGIKDSIFSQYDRAFTAFHGGPGSGLTNAQKLAGEGLRRYPDPPPAPDVLVADGPGRCDVMAWYPDDAMFGDSDTGVDDFRAWRVYRKQGDPWVNTTNEIIERGYRDWVMVAEIRADGVFNDAGQQIAGVALGADHYNREFTFFSGETRRVMHFGDVNVVRGEQYYYCVSAVDNGTQNTTGFRPGEPLEGSRYQTMTAKGGVGVYVTSYAPGISPNSGLSISGASPVSGLGSTIFALSQDALFDLNIGRGNTRALPVVVPAASTTDNTSIDHLVADIQAAIDAAVDGGKVVVGNTAIGKAAAAAAVEYTLTFATVEQNVVLGISGVNAATRDELGVNGGQIGRFVVVSPNPWSLDIGASLSSDQNLIFFDNLPPLCTLKIFTETGDLVRTIEHISGSAQEVWFQVNENAQLVKSGLYILAVVNAKDTDPLTGAPTEDLADQFVKFVIIR